MVLATIFGTSGRVPTGGSSVLGFGYVSVRCVIRGCLLIDITGLLAVILVVKTGVNFGPKMGDLWGVFCPFVWPGDPIYSSLFITPVEWEWAIVRLLFPCHQSKDCPRSTDEIRASSRV